MNRARHEELLSQSSGGQIRSHRRQRDREGAGLVHPRDIFGSRQWSDRM